MFPYPSGAGLHVGHPEGYTATDIICRYKRHARLQRPAPDGLGRLRPAGRAVRRADRRASARSPREGDRQLPAPAQALRVLLRLVARVRARSTPTTTAGRSGSSCRSTTRWFDLERAEGPADRGAGRELESGKRKVAFNPDAAEVRAEDKEQNARAPGRTLDKPTQRQLSTAIASPTSASRPSTGARSWAPCSPTRRSSTVAASAAAIPVLPQAAQAVDVPHHRVRDSGCSTGSSASTGPSPRTPSRPTGSARATAPKSRSRSQTPVAGHEKLRVFTTRPDTLFGATYMVVAPEHPLVDAVLGARAEQSELGTYVSAARNRTDVERKQSQRRRPACSPVFTRSIPSRARHPGVDEDYVLMGYGTGAIMAVPAPRRARLRVRIDLRLPIARKSSHVAGAPWTGERATAADGVAVNSRNADVALDGLPTARGEGADHRRGSSRRASVERRVNYQAARLALQPAALLGRTFPASSTTRRATHYPVSKARCRSRCPSSPTTSPMRATTRAAARQGEDVGADDGAAPAVDPATPSRDAHDRARPTPCPAGPARAGTTCATADPKNARAVRRSATPRATGCGDGVDLYVGGAEHAVLHLLYARFWHKCCSTSATSRRPSPSASSSIRG